VQAQRHGDERDDTTDVCGRIAHRKPNTHEDARHRAQSAYAQQDWTAREGIIGQNKENGEKEMRTLKKALLHTSQVMAETGSCWRSCCKNVFLLENTLSQMAHVNSTSLQENKRTVM
jgi:hypothetical protein